MVRRRLFPLIGPRTTPPDTPHGGQQKKECEWLVDGIFEEFESSVDKNIELLRRDLKRKPEGYNPPEDLEGMLDDMRDKIFEAIQETNKDIVWYCYYGEAAKDLKTQIG